MANDITRNPWVLDTPAAPSIATNVWLSLIIPRIEHIEFFDYTLDASIANIVDVDGHVICNLNGSSDLQAVRSGKIGHLHRGLVLSNVETVLNSGKVLVYIK